MENTTGIQEEASESIQTQRASRKVDPARSEASAVKTTAGKKTWNDWTKELNIRSSLARGGCVSVKADPDIPVTREEFEKAVNAFGGRRHGGDK